MPSGPATVGRVVGRTRDWLIGAVAWLSGGLFCVLFVLNLVQIVLRPINGGWIWVNDFSRLTFTWVVMLGAAAAYGKFDHIVVSFVAERLPARVKSVVAVLVRAVELTVGLILVVAGLAVVETRMNISSVQLGWPTGFTFAAVPALGALILIFGLTSRPHTHTKAEQLDQEMTHDSV
jgi:TRAP-type C4-dicarboxylate transport system permease small subunit